MPVKGKAILKRGVKGGSGSGNFGHSGRPGKLGGSIPKGAGGAGSTLVAAEFESVMKSPGIDAVSKLTQTLGLSEAEINGMVDDIISNTNIGWEDLHNKNTFKDVYNAAIADQMVFKSPTDATAVRNQFYKATLAREKTSTNPQVAKLGGTDLPARRGYSVKFNDFPGYYKIGSSLTDAGLDKQLAKIEKTSGKHLPRDPRSNWPTFTFYQDGEEGGGG